MNRVFVMSDHIKRMRKECEELKGRADKLKAFLGTQKFRSLDADYQSLLNRQMGVMTEYLIVLGQRLKREAG